MYPYLRSLLAWLFLRLFLCECYWYRYNMIIVFSRKMNSLNLPVMRYTRSRTLLCYMLLSVRFNIHISNCRAPKSYFRSRIYEPLCFFFFSYIRDDARSLPCREGVRVKRRFIIHFSCLNAHVYLLVCT